ncbi:calcium-binding protein [Roseicella frigidaeris]|uniref:hypothetical protein n=1 Tax=Roseicella frigidaeris TaxID=2230885 RepID=UPI001A9F9BB5|nr:hypothetical protein [Roseicella frigidaeris]
MKLINFQAPSSGGALDASATTGNAVMRGDIGDDTLIGSAQDDRLAGSSGHNLLVGGAGADHFFTTTYFDESDTIVGGDGDDSIYIATTSTDFARADIHNALADLTTFMKTKAGDPSAHFVNAVLNLDMSGVEHAFLRLDGVVQPLDVSPLDAGTPTPTTSAVTVTATAAIYNHDGDVSGEGAGAPVSIDLGTGTGRVVTVTNVGGGVAFGPDKVYNDADGFDFPLGTSLDPTAGLSGLTVPKSGMLVGVFLDGNEQAAGHAIPATLDFATLGTDFTTLAPGVDQVFYIGDGLTGTRDGTVQQFHVPDGATTLLLGIADGTAFHGHPEAYADNSGAFTAQVTVQDNVWHV